MGKQKAKANYTQKCQSGHPITADARFKKWPGSLGLRLGQRLAARWPGLGHDGRRHCDNTGRTGGDGQRVGGQAGASGGGRERSCCGRIHTHGREGCRSHEVRPCGGYDGLLLLGFLRLRLLTVSLHPPAALVETHLLVRRRGRLRRRLGRVWQHGHEVAATLAALGEEQVCELPDRQLQTNIKAG